jgi:hypothetical protein
VRRRYPAIFVLLLAPGACREKQAAPRPAPSLGISAKPLDRLAPGELRPGQKQVFGLEVPAGMVVRGEFLEVAYLHGKVTPEALANYVRDRVVVDHVEIGAARTVFPYARIKRGPADRFFQIEVIRGNANTELVIKDVTPRPKPPEQLTDEERWRRAGRRPDGKPLDIGEFK